MYQIDFLTATMSDVIARSVTCHPTLLAETLDTVSLDHRRFAGETSHKVAERIARSMAVDASSMANRLRDGDKLDAGLSNSEATIIFCAAYKLQCVPRYIADEIAARGYTA